MRILVIHTSYKIRGGEDSVVDNEVNLLRSAGHEVETLLFSNSDRALLKLIQLPYNYSSYQRVKYVINNFNPDLVHIHNLHFAGSTSVLYAIKKLKVPLVVTLHNYRMLCPSGTLFFNNQLFTSSVNALFPLKAVINGVYQKSVILTAWLAIISLMNQLAGTWNIPDKFIVLGQNAKDIFQFSKYRHLTSKMEIKPNFCYPYSNQQNLIGEDYLFVGRLSEEKGINTILKVFAKNGLPLKIVGSGPLKSEIESFASNYVNIQFLGVKDSTEVYNLISNAKAILFSSIWHETFGMVIIEAFACGTPVISSAIGEAMHLVTDHYNGLLYTPGDEDDLFDKVNYYQSLNYETLKLFKENALKSYNEFYTPKQNLDQLICIYNAAKVK